MRDPPVWFRSPSVLVAAGGLALVVTVELVFGHLSGSPSDVTPVFRTFSSARRPSADRRARARRSRGSRNVFSSLSRSASIRHSDSRFPSSARHRHGVRARAFLGAVRWLSRRTRSCCIAGSSSWRWSACACRWRSSRVRSVGNVRRAYRLSRRVVRDARAAFCRRPFRRNGDARQFVPHRIRTRSFKALLGESERTPAASSSARLPEKAAEPLVFAGVVQPILEKYCVECHGAKKQKGKLRLDSLDAMLKGGEGVPPLVAGSSASSELVKRVRLPVDDDDRMPPEGKPGPTPEELAVVVFWIH